jgi:hypothetical protein
MNANLDYNIYKSQTWTTTPAQLKRLQTGLPQRLTKASQKGAKKHTGST